MPVKRKYSQRFPEPGDPARGHLPPLHPRPGLSATGSGPEAGNQLIKIIRRRMEAVREVARLSAMNPEPDGIHDVRVASRRATECVGIMASGKIIKRSQAEAVVRLLRKMRRHGGKLRDMDVFLYDLSARGQRADEKALAAISARVASRRAGAIRAFIQSAMVVAVDPRMAGMMRILDQTELPVLRATLQRGLVRRIKRNRKRLLFNLNEAFAQRTVGAMHQARIAGKRMRYVCEIGDAANLTDTRRLRGSLRQFQQLVGELNDAAAAQTRLADINTSSLPVDTSCRRLSRKLQAIQQRRMARLLPRTMTLARSLDRLVRGMNLPTATPS